MHATPCPACGQLVCKPQTLNANQAKFGQVVLDAAFPMLRDGIVNREEAAEAMAALAVSFAEGLKAQQAAQNARDLYFPN